MIQTLPHELVGNIEHSKSSSQEQVEPVIPSLSKKEDILPSIDDKKSSEIAKGCSNVATGAVSKSKANVPQEQRNRKIKLPKTNKKNVEKDDKAKGSGSGKTKTSSK